MSQIDQELQSAKCRDDTRRDLQYFIDNYFEPYEALGICLKDAFMMAKLRDLDIIGREQLEVLKELYPDEEDK